MKLDNGNTLPLDKQVDDTINKAKNDVQNINNNQNEQNSSKDNNKTSSEELKTASKDAVRIKNSNFPNTNPTLNN